MDSFELNKILGAILGTLLFVMGLGFLAEAIYHPIEGRGPGFALASASPEGEGGDEETAAAAVDLGTLLASADAAAGEAAARKCTGCHNFAQGAGNKQGPELYAVVDRVIGGHEGFAYSAEMLAHKEQGDVWSYENLNAFLISPKGFMPGTKMAFPGIKDDAERANVLAYLGSLSPTPVAFPAPAAAAEPDAAPAAEDAAAPTEGTAPAEEGAPAEGTAPTEAAPSSVGGVPADAAPQSQTPAAVEGGAAPVSTPTETQSETNVQGTPTTSGPDGAAEPAPAEPVAQ